MSKGIPVAFYDRVCPDLPSSISLDNVESARKVVAHLIESISSRFFFSRFKDYHQIANNEIMLSACKHRKRPTHSHA